MLFLYYFVLDIAYQEFSETDGELDDSDGDNRVVEGDNNNILAWKENYLELNYMVPQFLSFPLFRRLKT